MLTGKILPRRREVLLDDNWHVFGRHARVPNVVRVDKDQGPLVVAAGTGVAQHDSWRQPLPLDLRAEHLEELAAALGAAAALPRCSANEDLP